MRKVTLASVSLAVLLLGVFGVPVGIQAAEAAKIKALVITGDDVGAHKWQETTPCTKDILDKAGKFDTTVVEGLTTLNSKEELAKYDVLYFMLYNNKKVELSNTAKTNLVDFVKDGKGLVVTHLASASFPKWEEWGKLCGRYWQMGASGHGPGGEFESKVVVKDHPVTKGLNDFKTTDELYAKLLGEEKINILVTADSDWSKKTEPMVWTLDYGKGRVACHTFGHEKKSFESAGVQKVIVNATLWAATGKTE
ncbi:MAG: ThuA domain-containing protein [bacterium]